MEQTISSRKAKKDASMETDPFSADVRRMVEQGLLALVPADILKCKLIELVQKHSAELPFLGGDVSRLFLNICDLMVSGDLRRMAPNVLKVYLVTMAYSGTPRKDVLNDRKALFQLTGIDDPSALSSALEHLRKEGYIDSNNSLLAVGARNGSKKSRRSGSGLLNQFPS